MIDQAFVPSRLLVSFKFAIIRAWGTPFRVVGSPLPGSFKPSAKTGLITGFQIELPEKLRVYALAQIQSAAPADPLQQLL